MADQKTKKAPEIGPEWSVFCFYFPWILLAFLIGLAVVYGKEGMFLHLAVVLIVLVVVYFTHYFTFKEVNADPTPEFGMWKIWGRFVDKALAPFKYLTLPFFPFFMEVVTFNNRVQELTPHFNEIPCMMEVEKLEGGEITTLGGNADLVLSYTFEPDPDSTRKYIKSGGLEETNLNEEQGTKTELQEVLYNNLAQSIQSFAIQKNVTDLTLIPLEVIGLFVLQNLLNKRIEITIDGTKQKFVEEDLLKLKRDGNSEIIKGDKTIKDNEIIRCIRSTMQDLFAEDENTDTVYVGRWGIILKQFKMGPIKPAKSLREAGEKLAAAKINRSTIEIRQRNVHDLIVENLKDAGFAEDGGTLIKDKEGYSDAYEAAKEAAQITIDLITKTVEVVQIKGANGNMFAEAAAINSRNRR